MGAPFFVPMALAAASAGAQAYNAQQSNSRAQASEVQAIQNQQDLRNKAAADVTKATQQIAADNPANLKAQADAQYVNELRRNAAGAQSGTTGGTQTFGQSTSSLPTNVNANKRYKQDVNASQKEVQQFGNTDANNMAGIDSAIRERQNEGLNLSTLQTNLDALGAQSWNQNFVDQLRAQSAGQLNPWISLGSAILGQTASGVDKQYNTVPEMSPVATLVAQQNAQALQKAYSSYNSSQGYKTGG